MPRRFLAPLALLCAPLFAAEPVSYSRDVQPILTNKCVACHACYDSPCQLNLGSGEGVLRGANKLPVYDGGRTKAQARSRRGWAGALVRPAPGGQTVSFSGTLPVQRGWDRPYRSSMPCMIRPLIS